MLGILDGRFVLKDAKQSIVKQIICLIDIATAKVDC